MKTKLKPTKKPAAEKKLCVGCKRIKEIHSKKEQLCENCHFNEHIDDDFNDMSAEDAG